MLTNKNIVCPENLLKIAKGKGPVKAVIVNAVKKVAIESAKQAVEANLITPLFVGDKSIIEKISELRKINITVLIVEQNARLSLGMSDRGYIFSNGKVIHTSKAENILRDKNIGKYFLGEIQKN